MLIDTHCHLNMMVKKEFDRPLTAEEIAACKNIIDDAQKHTVHYIINIGTSLSESINCTKIAQYYNNVYATVGIHPNDATAEWKKDLAEIVKLLQKDIVSTKKIKGIGEAGLDYHYPEYNKQRQHDVFKAQIELALTYDLALVVHTRDARDETLEQLLMYKNDPLRGIIHCFSEDAAFMRELKHLNFFMGIGGTITYPKNEILREAVRDIPLEKIVLETDAPFLPPQYMRGKQNNPAQIMIIADYLAQLLKTDVAHVAAITSQNAITLFRLPTKV
jgi:TatD DNase family protein